MIDVIATLPIERAADVFAVRQCARDAAAALGCDASDQVRLATALSELGRESLVHQCSSSAAFGIDGGALVIEMRGFPRAATVRNGANTGIEAARKLVHQLEFEDGDAPDCVTLRVRVPRPAHHADADGAKLRLAILRTSALGPLDELRVENRDLIATLDAVQAQREELARLNGELEETNRGVMAMYSQLSEELEETNRGVVALYAELDDKTVRLNAASEAKTRFLASVSHELRSPVNSTLGLVRLLLDPASDALSSEQHKQLQFIRTSANELLRLVNDLLDLAKAEAGSLEPEIRHADVAELFSELRGALRPLARPGVKLQVDVPHVPLLETDPTLVARVLRNLLTNALKFTLRGSVRLSASQSSPHEVAFTVSDTGIGVASEDGERIFEEFYQVRGPLQAEQRGTGLGLPYARRVTELLGGRLDFTSELGRGSVFTATFPLAWQRLLTARHSPGAASQAAMRVETVLIVDDDDGFRTALRGMLQGCARRVVEAGGGLEGLRMMRDLRPNLAFVDLRMPDMDGADVLAAMSQEPALREIPVVMVTSSELSGMRQTVGAAVALLAKANLDRDTVHAVVAEVCA